MPLEPLLFPISVRGRWGYIDQTGAVVIEPQFAGASKFSEGLAGVTVAGTSEEDIVFERKYEGFIGPDGRFVIPPEPPREAQEVPGFWTYSYGDFHEGLARIHINDATGQNGCIDRTGKVIIPIEFDTLSDFSEGLAFASIGGAWGTPVINAGFIDKQGRFVIENNAFLYSARFSGGVAAVCVRTYGEDRTDALIDKHGHFVIPPGVYSSLSSQVSGAIRAVRDGQTGLLDLNGNVLVPFDKYDNIVTVR